MGVCVCVAADLKFNSSSRMKPRWLVFALALPTDDVIFVQYTVPTIVMSRQCDQTPRVRSDPSLTGASSCFTACYKLLMAFVGRMIRCCQPQCIQTRIRADTRRHQI